MGDFEKKLIVHPDFFKTMQALSSSDIMLPNYGTEENSANSELLTDSGKITNLEEIKAYRIDARSGSRAAQEHTFAAYDETWAKFMASEGSAYMTIHSLILHGESDYLPLSLATFNFYTRSKEITSKSDHIKYAEKIEVEFSRDYIKDKAGFLIEYTPSHALLFVDGPLISGDLYTIMVDANSKFLEKGIFPIFFVKNSASNIVTSNIEDLRGKYNSDIHWLHNLLKPGERSCFFKYEDQVQRKNTKVFCYLKAFDSSPQRIEFHTDSYLAYAKQLDDVLDLILYLMYVQGSRTNPQLRPIAIAEKYARTVLKCVDINRFFAQTNMTPTINQIRFGG